MEKKNRLQNKSLIEEALLGHSSNEELEAIIDLTESDPGFKGLVDHALEEGDWIHQQIIDAEKAMDLFKEVDEKVAQIEKMNQEPDLNQDREELFEEFLEYEREQARKQEQDHGFGY